MRKLALIILFIPVFGVAQNRGNVWCFGHEAAIDFNGTIPIPDSSRVISRGSCASICDTSGNLLFYTSDDTVALYASTINGAKIYSKNHQLMQNGDSLNAQAWYNEILIIPKPAIDSLYYVFTIGVTSFYGLYYSLVDISQNGGLGMVTQKNVQLQSFEQVDCLAAIKHGNGLDWWLVFRKFNGTSVGNSDYYEYLITPNGIGNVMTQNIGSLNHTNAGNIAFNTVGDKMMFTNLAGMMELYDFDRCTGVINNPNTIFPEQTGPYNRLFFGTQFSPSDNLFYTTLVAIPGYTDSCYLIQYSLNSPNIATSADTLLISTLGSNMGQLKLGPDNKIYLSTVYNNFVTSSYPYPDTVNSIYNDYLSVINSPDSLGTACDFQSWSFYLGGKRSYYGLPNNPDYDLGPLIGSLCDSLTTGLTPDPSLTGEGSVLYTSYVSEWEKLFINAQHLKGNTYALSVTDITGRVVYKASGRLSPPGAGGSGGYFTKDLDCSAFSRGMYIVTIATNKEQVSKKFVKN